MFERILRNPKSIFCPEVLFVQHPMTGMVGTAVRKPSRSVQGFSCQRTRHPASSRCFSDASHHSRAPKNCVATCHGHTFPESPLGVKSPQKTTDGHQMDGSLLVLLPVVPHLRRWRQFQNRKPISERLVVVNHGWQSESTDWPKGGWSCVCWSGCNGCSGHLTHNCWM